MDLDLKDVDRPSIAMYSDPEEKTYYSSCCFMGQELLENAKETLISCLDKILRQRREDDVITLADYGTADGGNVIDHMNTMIEHIHGVKGKDQEINIILEDQQLNDFNVLIQKVKGMNGRKCLRESDSIHTLMSGTSMYSRCLPRNTLDLGCSTVAVHWLSKWPVNIKAGMTIFDADENELKLIKQQASVDWKNFVVNRGMEMKSGAYFLVISGNDSEKRTECVYRILTKVCNSMLKDNSITQEEHLRMNVHTYQIRPVEELSAIFSVPDVSSLGLELVSARTSQSVGVPSIDKENVTESEMMYYTEQLTKFVRTWNYNAILSGLSGDRNRKEKEAIANEYFDHFYKTVLEEKYTDGFTAGMGEILFKKV